MLISANSNQPWNSTIPTLVLFPKCKTSVDVDQIHARLLTTGLINDYSLTTKLILSFCSSPHAPLVHFARYVFFSQHAYRNPRNKEDPFLWNRIIKSFSHGDDPKQAPVIFSSMLETGDCVDKFSFSLVFKACSRLGLVKEGMQLHGLMVKFGTAADLFLQNCLVCMYLRCGCLGIARCLFDRMPNRDAVSFNLMIDGYVKCGMLSFARQMFDSMPVKMKNVISWNSIISGYVQVEDGYRAAWELFELMPQRDLVSWNLMIDCCVKCGKMEIARALFNYMPQRDVISWVNMINGYAKMGSIGIARGLFDKMPHRDVIACNAMMSGYVQNGFCKEALKIFHDMLNDSNLSPDNATLLISLTAIAQLGHVDEGVAIHYYIEDNKFSVGGKLGVGLIDMYSKCGCVDKALHIFEDTEMKTVDHWNAMICGLAVHGMGKLAFDLFMDMERLSVKPDEITFIGLLNACGHSGLVKEGQICFEIMRRVHKFEPKLHHYGCMVDILGRAGHIQEAKTFIGEMPIKPNDVVWRTLLSACKIHENLNVGETIAEHLMALDSSSSGSYVLLSNMYADFGMWEYVRKVRTAMKNMALKKIPGCSRIELEGDVHEFFVGGTSLNQVARICSLLEDGCLRP